MALCVVLGRHFSVLPELCLLWYFANITSFPYNLSELFLYMQGKYHIIISAGCVDILTMDSIREPPGVVLIASAGGSGFHHPLV